jgi:hypothetical protein
MPAGGPPLGGAAFSIVDAKGDSSDRALVDVAEPARVPEEAPDGTSSSGSGALLLLQPAVVPPAPSPAPSKLNQVTHRGVFTAVGHVGHRRLPVKGGSRRL